MKIKKETKDKLANLAISLVSRQHSKEFNDHFLIHYRVCHDCGGTNLEFRVLDNDEPKDWELKIKISRVFCCDCNKFLDAYSTEDERCLDFETCNGVLTDLSVELGYKKVTYEWYDETGIVNLVTCNKCKEIWKTGIRKKNGEHIYKYTKITDDEALMITKHPRLRF